ncbi:Mur ligase family protein [Pedobacter sp. KLB.chiD]|uniref:Mur ligase family protein n=1 Tax=Pedobacter sp. KLB.chiD TaxID=3387402 RepID=UPI00399AA37E
MINISVMGSVGKSTTSHALAWYLANFGQSYFCGLGNYPKHVSAAKKRADATRPNFCVYEVSGAALIKGSTKTIGEKSNAIINPDVLLFTTIAPAHYSWCGSLKEIARRKMEAFKKIKKGGVLILNADSKEFETLKSGWPAYTTLLTYGTSDHCQICFDVYEGTIKFRGLSFDIKFPLFFSAYEKLNIVGCVSAILSIVPLINLPKTFDFSKLPTLDGRGKLYKNVKLFNFEINLISDCYNSNPISMQNGLHKFSKLNVSGRKIVVICQMKDLGSLEIVGHETVIRTALNLKFDLVIAIGELYHVAIEQHLISCKIENLDEILRNNVRNGDTLYFKGSHMYGLWGYVNNLVGNKSNLKAKFYECREPIELNESLI